MIEFKNVNFSIDEKPILQDISFFIPEGESRVIMGHSGSGKSTLLRLILGLHCPDSGQIIVQGKNICGMKKRGLIEIRKQMGMVFQEGALFDSLTVGENIGYYLIEHTRMRLDEIDEKVREMLGFLGLSEDIIDRLPDELSGGMQRRVAIGRALLSTNPKIMLYDEPTTGLDPQMTETIVTLINRLTATGKVTSIIVTHQIPDALEVADKFIIIEQGRIIFDGDIAAMAETRDNRVVEFLRPFRDSIANAHNKAFI